MYLMYNLLPADHPCLWVAPSSSTALKSGQKIQSVSFKKIRGDNIPHISVNYKYVICEDKNPRVTISQHHLHILQHGDDVGSWK
jgi:hypothetical protein